MDREASGIIFVWLAVKSTTTVSAVLRTLRISAPLEPRQDLLFLVLLHFIFFGPFSKCMFLLFNNPFHLLGESMDSHGSYGKASI